jgi:IS5 family transposase
MRRRAHGIGAWLRRRTEVAKQEAKAITAEMADIAEMSLAEARKVAANARRGLRRAGGQAPGKAKATLGELDTLISRLGQVVAQSRLRLSGEVPPGATRLVSLHDPDARPIFQQSVSPLSEAVTGGSEAPQGFSGSQRTLDPLAHVCPTG